MYNIDEKTNAITKAVIEQGEVMKSANKAVILLKRVVGLADDAPLNEETINSLEGKTISLKGLQPDESAD